MKKVKLNHEPEIGYSMREATERNKNYDGLKDAEITEEDWADYQDTMRRYGDWQEKLDKLWDKFPQSVR